MKAHVNARDRVIVCARGMPGFDIKGDLTVAGMSTERVKKTNNKHGKHCAYNVILWCLPVTNVAMEKQNFTTCVFVSGLHAVAIAIKMQAFLAYRDVGLADL
jgi:hypothetical protein